MTIEQVKTNNKVKRSLINFVFLIVLLSLSLSVGAQENTDSVKTLDEVEIIARRNLTKSTPEGISYSLSKDPYANKLDLFSALGRVPMLNVNIDGNIMVSGYSQYHIYLNGKPYSVAQTDPRAALSGIPASVIARVEVITNPALRFGAGVEGAVINIVTLRKTLDGYHLTLNAAGETQPKADGGVNLLGATRKVEWSAGYTYKWQSQQKQRNTSDYTYFSPDANLEGASDYGDGAHGNWQNHLVRAMAEWQIDTLNSIYADAHALFNGRDFRNTLMQTRYYPSGTSHSSTYTSSSDYWDGTVEANLIYRNFFTGGTRQRINIGYRFTHNPDKRRYDDMLIDNETKSEEVISSKTAGAMNDHSLTADYMLPLGGSHSMRFDARQILRIGNATSKYSENELLLANNADKLHYNQNVTSANAFYSGYLDSGYRFGLQASVGFNYLHTAIAAGQTDAPLKRDFIDFLPTAGMSWRLDNSNSLRLNYTSGVARPGITQLNPFEGGGNSLNIESGNPNLKSSRSDVVKLEFSRFTNRYFFSLSVGGSFTKDAISPYYKLDKRTMTVVSTYANIQSVKQLQFSLFASWSPFSKLSILAIADAGLSRMRSRDFGLSQKGWNYMGVIKAEYNPDYTWTVGSQFNFYKVADQPWTTFRPGRRYEFYVKKILLGGRLNIGLKAVSPFNKTCGIYKQTLSTPDMVKVKRNWIQARSFGVSVTYMLHGGNKIKLKRNTSLRSSDLVTGVE